MLVIHVITGLQKAAGTTTFVENVVEGMRSHGQDAEIVTSADCFKLCDVMHIHGLWSGLLHNAAAFARRNRIPVVWSTHGMTAPWSMRHKWWKKLPAWWLYQKWDLRRAAAIHCTTDQEVEWNRALGYDNCFTVPLGTKENQFHSPTSTHNSNSTHILLFVGRIYPVKGLVNLIKAWGIVKERRREGAEAWKLRIVGPNQAGHQAQLEALVQELNLIDSVDFAGPRFGDELSLEYEKCDCLALPSFTENFGATVVDALAHGKSCIASTFTPWRELKDRGCGWWVSNAPERLAEAIREMMSLSEAERRGMGARGRKLVDEKYTWDAVVKALVKVYEEVLNG